jgi:hypothetical protein
MVTKYQNHFMAKGKIMTKKKQPTDSQIMKDRAKAYGPAVSQMAVIGVIQMELSKYCLERSEGKPSREALAHLASLNLGIVKVVRAISNPGHGDNYCDGRNYATIAEECAE